MYNEYDFVLISYENNAGYFSIRNASRLPSPMNLTVKELQMNFNSFMLFEKEMAEKHQLNVDKSVFDSKIQALLKEIHYLGEKIMELS